MWRNWDIFRELDSLHRELDELFENVAPARRRRFRPAFLPGRSARHYPMMNIYDNAEEIVVEALAPGLDTESLEVNVQRNVLTVSGEKKPLEGVKPEDYHRSERATGRFIRTFQLSSEVDEDKAEARYENGVLVVRLPKAEHAKPKQITVKV